MGGYYTNNYGYYNPYLEEERKRQEEIKVKEQMRQQYDAMKVISMSASKCGGSTFNEKRFEDMYAPAFQQAELSQEEKNQMQLLDVYYNGIDYNPNMNAIFEAQSRVYEYRQTLVPKDCDLYEFMDKSVNLVDEILKKEEQQRNVENLSRLYNKDSYKQLVGMYKEDSENYWAGMYDNNDPMNVSIDDVESKLPPYKESENVKARRQFMDKILSQIEQRNSEGYKHG